MTKQSPLSSWSGRLPVVRLSCAALFAIAALAPSAARAEELTEKGALTFSADRLFGLYAQKSVTDTAGGGERRASHTDVGLFTSAPTSIYALPRLAFDATIIDHLTVGGALGFSYARWTRALVDAQGVAAGPQGPGTTTFLIAPRVGYALAVAHHVAIWLRGGMTYFHSNLTNDDVAGKPSFTVWGIALNVEPSVVIAPTTHFGFLVGLLADLPLDGHYNTERTVGGATITTTVDHSLRNLGINAGLVGSF